MGRRSRDSGVDGFAVVDKAPGMTSHDVVARARKLLGTSRIGHAGTLDPDATGVLLLGVGRATKLLRFMTELPKSYTGEVVLGVETSTLDAAGTVTATHEMGHVTIDDVRAVARKFVGDIMQIPPMVSAIKVDGRRLHELAREGIEIERAPRPVTIRRVDVESTAAAHVYRIEVDCSSGTYIRSLAADIGHALGGGAHLRDLRRTAIGSFTAAEARPVEEVELRPMADALRDFANRAVDSEVAAMVRNGRVLGTSEVGPSGPAERWSVTSPDGDLLAVYEPTADGRARPAVVIPAR